MSKMMLIKAINLQYTSIYHSFDQLTCFAGLQYSQIL